MVVATTQFELVTPSQTLYSGAAEMIVCRTVNGEVAFLANHMPYIGALDTGVVRIVGPEADGATGTDIRVAVRGGFVEVKDNQVIMLANEAELASDIDAEAARRDVDAGGDSRPASRDGAGEGDDAGAGEARRWAQVRVEAASA